MTIETTEARKELLRVGEPYLLNSSGRMKIWVDGKHKFYSHYIWFLNTGHWPDWKNKQEIIHHIDGDPLNDDFNNLALMTNSEHSRMNNIGRPKSKEHRTKLSEAIRGEKSNNWKGDDASALAKYSRHYRYPNKYPLLTKEEKEEFRAHRRAYHREKQSSLREQCGSAASSTGNQPRKLQDGDLKC